MAIDLARAVGGDFLQWGNGVYHIDHPNAGGVNDGATDNTAALTAIRTAANGARAKVLFGEGTYRFDSALNASRLQLIGIDPPGSTGGGGTVLSFPTTSGIYSSVEDQRSYSVKNMRIVGASARTANGFTGIDFTGCNYPRLWNVRLANFENGVVLENGSVVECHYGKFWGVDFDQCYRAVYLPGAAHSHKIYGGRFWDCVEGIHNVDATDIACFGSEFESDTPVVHPAGSDPQTTLFGCREESNANASILAGTFAQIGDYWSGYGRAAAYAATSGVVSFRNIMSVGNNGDTQPVAPNLLRNPGFVPIVGGTSVPGWTGFSGTVTHMIGAFGRVARVVSGSATVTLTQTNIRLPIGRYTAGFSFQRDSADAGFFTARLRILANGGATTLMDESAIAGDYRGGVYNYTFDTAADWEDVTFEIIFGTVSGKTIFVGSPFLAPGGAGGRYSQAPEIGRPVYEGWAAAAPSAGTWSVGDRVWNTAPAASGTMGWVCTTAGTPGTWKTFGAIAA